MLYMNFSVDKRLSTINPNVKSRNFKLKKQKLEVKGVRGSIWFTMYKDNTNPEYYLNINDKSEGTVIHTGQGQAG